MDFSVLLPVYHKVVPYEFDLALKSINDNSLRPSQVIIVIDGPVSEEIESVIVRNMLPNYVVVRMPRHLGIVAALNLGLEYCKTELVARCDADDVNRIDRFELQLNAFLRDDKIDVCGGQVLEISESGAFMKEVPVTDFEIKRFLRRRNPINHMTVMYKKSAVAGVGRYPDIKFREDYALWAKLASNQANFFNLTDVLVEVKGGLDMYKRRGRASDIFYEVKLQNFLYSHKIINFAQYGQNLIIRGANLFLPSVVRAHFYKSYLRRRIQKAST